MNRIFFAFVIAAALCLQASAAAQEGQFAEAPPEAAVQEADNMTAQIVAGQTISAGILEKINRSPDELQRVIIRFTRKPGGYREFIEKLDARGRMLRDYKIIEGVAVEIPGKWVEALKGMKGVISIEEDKILRASLAQSAPLIKANGTWALGYNGSGKCICIVDTGIDYRHPALGNCTTAQFLAGNCTKVAAGYDFANNDNDPLDDHGHGTHCAGIAASTNMTYRGIAPGATLLAAKVLDSSGSGWASDTISGIEWCSNHGADVISMSLGGSTKFSSYCDSEADAEAVNNAAMNGAVVAVASGNDAWTDGIESPACASKAISVGAVYDANVGGISWSACTDSTTSADKITCFTDRNRILDVLAPGAIITSAKPGGGFTDMGGTSMATPHAAGAAAVLLQAKPWLTPFQVESVLKSSGKNVYDSRTGLTFPRIDVLAAVNSTPPGRLEPYVIGPMDRDVQRYKIFNFSSGVDCTGGVCGNVSAYLKMHVASSPATCSQIWGFSCGTGPPDGDNTFDNCNTGSENKEGISEIYLDRSAAGLGERIEVKCFTSDPTYVGDALYIYYRNSSTGTWKQKLAVGQAYPASNYSAAFIPDPVAGQHQVRCIIDRSPENDRCANNGYYDNDDANFSVVDNNVPSSGQPFYTFSANPQRCDNMQSGGACATTWNVNATGALGTYGMYVLYQPLTYPLYMESNATGTASVRIVENTTGDFISITLSGYPVGFGGLDPGTGLNPASGNAAGSYQIRVEPETTVAVDIYQKGDDFTGGGKIIGLKNMTWAATNDAGVSVPLTHSYSMLSPADSNISAGTQFPVYYWFTVPLKQAASTYTAAISIHAVRTGTPPPAEKMFAWANGTEFYFMGRPFHYAGTNNYYLWYKNLTCDSQHPPPSEGCAAEVLDDSVAANLTVIRTWLFGDGNNSGNGWDGYYFQPQPGVYDENTFAHFDRLIKMAKDRGLMLILSLVNNWNDFGGMNQYVSWCGGGAHDNFYTMNCTRELYKNYTRYVLNRNNTATGVLYKDEPAIFAWELANEPEATSDTSGMKLRNWISEMGAWIKGIDAGHMLTTGEEGYYSGGSGWRYDGSRGMDFINDHSLHSIDFASYHLYPDHWNTGYADSINWIVQHTSDAHNVIGKPVILGEMGKNQTSRDSYFSGWHKTLETNSSNGDNFWILYDHTYKDYDKFGIYCPENATTCGLISGHANYMNSLN